MWWSLSSIAVLGVLGYFGLPYLLRTGEHEPPINTVVIDGRLATSGQPSAAQLRRLRADGYEAVVNLAPPDAYGSVANEAEIVRDQGLAYYNIPVDWARPSPGDLDEFRSTLNRLRGRKLWVHCQMNMRASVFVFLWRVIDLRVPPEEAVGPIHAIWVPNAVWSDFMRRALGRAGVVYPPDLLR